MREVVRGDALPPCVRAARGKLHTWTRKGLGTRRGANDGCIHIKGFLHVSISILFFRLQCSISYCSYDCAMCNSYAYTVSVPPETATLRTPTCGTLWYLWNFRKQIQLSQIAIRYRKIQLSQDWYMWWLRFMHSDPIWSIKYLQQLSDKKGYSMSAFPQWQNSYSRVYFFVQCSEAPFRGGIRSILGQKNIRLEHDMPAQSWYRN